MAYFDNAATTYPKPDIVYQQMDNVYRSIGGSAGRGEHSGSKAIGRLSGELREAIKLLLHCPAKQVIFTPTGTLALNMILQGVLQSGIKNVYITPFEHNLVRFHSMPGIQALHGFQSFYYHLSYNGF